MAKSKRTVWECDNMDCREAQIEWPGAEHEVTGIFLGPGSFSEAGGGGPLRKIYACSLECVGPAVRDVRDEVWKN